MIFRNSLLGNRNFSYYLTLISIPCHPCIHLDFDFEIFYVSIKIPANTAIGSLFGSLSIDCYIHFKNW